MSERTLFAQAAVTALLAIGLARHSGAAPRPTRECPIEIVSNKPWVQVAINQSAPQWFILDTGASGGTILARETADRLELRRGSETSTHIGAGAGVNVGVATLPNVMVQVAGDTMSVPAIRVFSMAHVSPFEGRRLDGLLGEDFLWRHVVEIDYAKRRLRILDPAGYSPSPAATVVPIHVIDGLAMADCEIVRPGEAPIPCRFVIDTGVRTTLILYHPFVVKHRFLETTAPMITATIGGGAGGETKGDLGRLESLRVGAIAFARSTVIYSRDTVGVFAGDDADGIVGGEILRRCKTTFDYPHSRLVLEPYANLPPLEYDMSGLFLVGQGTAFDRVTVLSVAARTPAAEAGLAKGDEIERIDGKPASEIGLEGTRGLFRKPAKYRLEVKRGEGRVQLELTTRRLV